MNSSFGNKRKVRKSDVSRVLLSETIPYDVPIIFTNNWFYNLISNYESINDDLKLIVESVLVNKDLRSHTVPMKYKIRKTASSLRELSVLHPSSQHKWVHFYSEFYSKIVHYCSKSKFSIRAPSKISSTYYIKNNYEDLRKLKSDTVNTSRDENKFKHFTSFFAYDGYTKVSKFFTSDDFYQLETKYSIFKTLDISRCFDSIYTHSIEWAAKNKGHAKTVKNGSESFASIFDALMRNSNYKETNGIVVGNEVSRIFAEVILQDTDCEVEKRLKDKSILLGKDYDIRRYVDDYFIFASDDYISKVVENEIEDVLRKFKLFFNHQKSSELKKPFITPISRSILQTNSILKEYEEFFFEKKWRR